MKFHNANGNPNRNESGDLRKFLAESLEEVLNLPECQPKEFFTIGVDQAIVRQDLTYLP